MDLVVAISVGTIAGSATITRWIPLWVGHVGLGALAAFEWLGIWVMSRSPEAERVLSGVPALLARAGALRSRALQAAMLPESAVGSMLRARGLDCPGAVREV